MHTTVIVVVWKYELCMTTEVCVNDSVVVVVVVAVVVVVYGLNT